MKRGQLGIERVMAILENPPDKTHREIAREEKLSAWTVQRIRTGTTHKDVAPWLPRHDASVFTRSCTDCDRYSTKKVVEWTEQTPEGPKRYVRPGACTIGIPESVKDTRFAPMCSAFLPKEEDPGA